MTSCEDCGTSSEDCGTSSEDCGGNKNLPRILYVPPGLLGSGLAEPRALLALSPLALFIRPGLPALRGDIFVRSLL